MTGAMTPPGVEPGAPDEGAAAAPDGVDDKTGAAAKKAPARKAAPRKKAG
jgi:hypothetical protein